MLREPAELALPRMLAAVLQHVIEEVAAFATAVQCSTGLVVDGMEGAGPWIGCRRAMLALPVTAERTEVGRIRTARRLVRSAARIVLFALVHRADYRVNGPERARWRRTHPS